MTSKRFLTAGLVLLLAGTALAQQTPAPTKPATDQPAAKDAEPAKKELMVGDKAPALMIEKWVKGEPVTGFEKGKVYLLDFWATWCGPCVASIPHLTELQKEYKDKGVTVIGVTCKDMNGNSLPRVEKMVETKGDKMAYTVAWDTDRKTNEAYMEAADQHYIPCAFIIDREGRVAFIGNDSYEEPLAQVVAGTYDIKTAAANYKTEKENAGKIDEIKEKIGEAAQDEKWAEVISGMDQLAKLKPSQAAEMAAQKFVVMLTKQNAPDKAYAFGREAIDGAAKNNAMALNTIAWMIVDPEQSVDKKDLDLALKAAQRADELTKNKDGMIIDTLARVYWEKGEKAKAVELQTKAVGLVESDPRMKEQLQKSLDEYKKATEKKD